jgi:serine/threonine-protein phosphatase 2B regulatory subunit
MGTAPLNENFPQINFDKNELKILYKNYMSMDKNKNGIIEYDEFFDVPELKNNPIVQRLLNVFDKNNDGKISYYEFIWGLSALTSDATIEEKQKIAFDIYDINKDGYISNGDLFKTTKILVGENLNDIQIQQLTDRTILRADKDLDGMLSYEEFCNFTKNIKIQDLFSIDVFSGLDPYNKSMDDAEVEDDDE